MIKILSSIAAACHLHTAASGRTSHIATQAVRAATLVVTTCLAVMVAHPHGFADSTETADPQEVILSEGLSPEPSGVVPSPQVSIAVGRSAILDLVQPASRVSVTDPAIADVRVISPTQLLLNGFSPGATSLVVWDETQRATHYDVLVLHDLAPLLQQLASVAPGDRIEAYYAADSIVLSGAVSEAATVEKAGEIARAYSDKVINLLEPPLVDSKQIKLHVMFVEVNRTALKELGINTLFEDSALGEFLLQGGSYIGNVSSPSIPLIPLVPGRPLALLEAPSQAATDITALSDNVTAFLTLAESSRNLTVLIRALEQRGELHTLAEPTLVTVSGNEASFLAGGEFPVPIVTSASTGVTDRGGAIDVEFKEFGVKLTFTPTVLETGKIDLIVAPEVSTLDFENGVQLSGFRIPALRTRKVLTRVELNDGASLIIGGLLSRESAESLSQIPFLGTIPVLGTLFRSKRFLNQETELMVLITPRIAGELPVQKPISFEDAGPVSGPHRAITELEGGEDVERRL